MLDLRWKFDLDRGQGQMVQWDQMCIFPQGFQIIKAGVDISSNSWDIAIYVKTALTSNSRSYFRFVKSLFTESQSPFYIIHDYIKDLYICW